MAQYNDPPMRDASDVIINPSPPPERQGGTLDQLLDLIAEELILSEFVNTADVENNQKFIRDGQLQSGQGSGVLALFQKDVEANKDDLNQSISVPDGFLPPTLLTLQQIADNVDFNSLVITVTESYIDGAPYIKIRLSDTGIYSNGEDITNLITIDGDFSNTSQFVPLQQSSSIVNIDKAEEFLDTNIFELLPTGDTRQARITRFFQELNALLPPETPEFDINNDGVVDRTSGSIDWTGSLQYSQDNSISYAQDNQDGNIDEEDAFIHRLKSTANDTNVNKTIEDIYRKVEPYLTDILEDPLVVDDLRPEYRNQSSGYIQFRNLNQGIIIRNTTDEFVEGLNPNTQEYLTTGFTITMWVKFLDKKSQGTLFNFGSPFRTESPFGFALETYVIDGNELPTNNDFNPNSEGNYLTGFGSSFHTWKEIFQDGDTQGLQWTDEPNRQAPNEGFFSTTDTERFVRLVVHDGTRLLGSHVGMPFMARRAGLPDFGYQDYYTNPNTPGTPQSDYDHAYGLMTNVLVPYNPNEWYFICATYNSTIQEDESCNPYSQLYDSALYDEFKFDSDFWRNHRNIDGSYSNDSNYGAKCKVEIISRSDLLRARGFKV